MRVVINLKPIRSIMRRTINGEARKRRTQVDYN